MVPSVSSHQLDPCQDHRLHVECKMFYVDWDGRHQLQSNLGLSNPPVRTKCFGRLNISYEKNLVQYNICCLKIVLVCDFSSMYLYLRGLVQQCDLNLVQNFQLADNLETINNLYREIDGVHTCAFMLAPSMYTWPPLSWIILQISSIPSSYTPWVEGYVTWNLNYGQTSVDVT